MPIPITNSSIDSSQVILQSDADDSQQILHMVSNTDLTDHETEMKETEEGESEHSVSAEDNEGAQELQIVLEGQTLEENGSENHVTGDHDDPSKEMGQEQDGNSITYVESQETQIIISGESIQMEELAKTNEPSESSENLMIESVNSSIKEGQKMEAVTAPASVSNESTESDTLVKEESKEK